MSDQINPDIIVSDIVETEAEYIPLLSPEDEQRMSEEDVPEVLPLLPLRNAVLFPGVVMPITVGRDKSIRLVKDAYKYLLGICVIVLCDAELELTELRYIFSIGTVAQIIKTLQMPDGNTTVIIQGKRRFILDDITETEPYIKGKTRAYGENVSQPRDKKFAALIQSVKDMAMKIMQKSSNMPFEASLAIKNIESPWFMVNFVASNLVPGMKERQALLEIADITKFATTLLEVLNNELQMIELKHQIQNKVKSDMDKQQREYLLNQQLRTIQEELGGTPNEMDIKELQKKAAKKKWSREVEQVFEKELRKLERMNPQVADYGIQHNYRE